MCTYKYNDGGRIAAGYKGTTGDCFVRALAISAQLDYQYAYDLVNDYGKRERIGKRKSSKSTARTGVYTTTARKICDALGFTWVPTMHIGSGCSVHLKASELPAGRLVCSVSRHYVAVINGEINDTYNPDRDGTRCVYGYWICENAAKRIG